ncbi:MAG: Na+/H+ antiporter NhaA [Pseudomonadota bacterium]
MDKAAERLKDFIKMEASGGIVLAGAAVLAILIANSPLAGVYDLVLLKTYATVGFGDWAINKPLIYWINDGLMAVFFFLVGLEIKREMMEGELSSPSKIALPAIAALGGVLIPVKVYLWINVAGGGPTEGWPIPAATDIAFALAVLTLVGTRAPVALKAFLLAIAVIDDLIAVTLIAVLFTAELKMMPLLAGLFLLAVMFWMNRRGVRKISPYILVAVVMWALVLESGVHATLAGVAAAFAIPLRRARSDIHGENHSPLTFLEHKLHYWVAFGILPVFALANAGFSFEGLSLQSLTEPLALGIMAGLVVGKQVGIFAFSFAAVKFGFGAFPKGVTWTHVYGVACLAGIGFTMSLFIGGLAFEDPSTAADVRLGVLAGSIISGAVGFVVLRFLAPDARTAQAAPAAQSA